MVTVLWLWVQQSAALKGTVLTEGGKGEGSYFHHRAWGRMAMRRDWRKKRGEGKGGGSNWYSLLPLSLPPCHVHSETEVTLAWERMKRLVTKTGKEERKDFKGEGEEDKKSF